MKRKYVRGRNGRIIERVLPETPVDVARLRLAEQEIGQEVHGDHSLADSAEEAEDVDEERSS